MFLLSWKFLVGKGRQYQNPEIRHQMEIAGAEIKARKGRGEALRKSTVYTENWAIQPRVM